MYHVQLLYNNKLQRIREFRDDDSLKACTKFEIMIRAGDGEVGVVDHLRRRLRRIQRQRLHLLHGPRHLGREQLVNTPVGHQCLPRRPVRPGERAE